MNTKQNWIRSKWTWTTVALLWVALFVTAVTIRGEFANAAGELTPNNAAQKTAPAGPQKNTPHAAGNFHKNNEFDAPFLALGDGQGNVPGSPGGMKNPTTNPAESLEDITPEQTNQILEMLRVHNPALGEQFAEAQRKNPEAVRTMIRDNPKLLEMLRMYRNDPKLFNFRLRDIRFDKQTREMVQQYRQAMRSGDQARIDAAKADLTKMLSDHFQARQQLREQELEKLEQKISQMRAALESRKAHKDQLIAERLKELTGESSAPEW